jgi:3-oxoacyl-[acyl-carrier protein] reductase
MANPFDAYRLDDRVAVVTGAASGIGAATCEVLAAAGATLVCGDVNADGLDTTVKLAAEVGGRALAVATDVTVRSDVERLVGAAVNEFGRIDAMCNIAGAMFPGLIEDLDDETIDRGIDLNLKGVLYGTQYAVRAMKPFGRGSIVNVSSAAIDERTRGSASTRSPKPRWRCSP